MSFTFPLLTIDDLYKKAEDFLKSIPLGNKGKTFTPTGEYQYLKKDAVLQSITKDITYGTGTVSDYGSAVASQTRTGTSSATFTVMTNESIPASYTKAVTETAILSEWELYKSTYINPKFNTVHYITINYFVLFLYLFNYFLIEKITRFTDMYGKSKIWLYNTDKISYKPDTYQLNIKEFNTTTLSSYIKIITAELLNNVRHTTTLSASVSGSCCSSSSSSSSCSSSCSSSSCSSSSSSSSSSMYIIYFNI